MKILNEIKLVNFLSHSNTIIKVGLEQKALIDGTSGAGKSSIVEALVWAFYAKSRTDNKSLIRHGTKKGSVEVLMTETDSNTQYKITRSISDTNKHTLEVKEMSDGKFIPIKVSGMKLIQEHLEKNILNSSYLLFVNSIVYLQDNIDSFVKQTASKRKDVILEIVNSGDYDSYLKKAKSEIQSRKIILEVNESKISDRRDTIEKCKEEANKLDQYRTDQAVVRKEIKNSEEIQTSLFLKKEEVNSKITALSNDKENLKDAKNKITENNTNILELNKKIIEIQSVDNTSLKISIEKLSELKNELIKEEDIKDIAVKWSENMNIIKAETPSPNDYTVEIKSINKDIIEIMSEPLPSCASCGTPYPHFEESKRKRIEDLSSKLKLVTERSIAYNEQVDKSTNKAKELGNKPEFDAVKIIELKREIEKLSEAEISMAKSEAQRELIPTFSKDIDKLTASNKELNIKVEDLNKKLSLDDGLQKELDNMLLEISKISTLMSSLNSDNADLQGKIALAEVSESNIKESKEELKVLSEKVDKEKDNIDCLIIMKDAFGQNGIKSIVVDYVIPQLEDRINNVLSKLSNFRIKLETQKSGLTKDTLLEGLFITIINDIGDELDFLSYSGGERIKITLAIFEGLASIQKFGFRFFDESVVGLDSETIDSFAEVMLQLKKEVNQLFCISHLSHVKELFDKKLTVIKNNGVSKII